MDITIKTELRTDCLDHKCLHVMWIYEDEIVYKRDFTLAMYYRDDISKMIEKHTDKLRSNLTK